MLGRRASARMAEAGMSGGHGQKSPHTQRTVRPRGRWRSRRAWDLLSPGRGGFGDEVAAKGADAGLVAVAGGEAQRV